MWLGLSTNRTETDVKPPLPPNQHSAPRISLSFTPQDAWTDGDVSALLAAKAVLGDSDEDWDVVATAVGRAHVYFRAQYAKVGGVQRLRGKPHYALQKGA